ncbi:Protodermal factor 1 [Glycine soja]|nr:hypothetical protein JHK87_005472 [Glycine soja]
MHSPTSSTVLTILLLGVLSQNLVVPVTCTPTSSPTPFTGTSYYWSSNPGRIKEVLGWVGTIGSAFGVGSSNNKIPSNVSLVHALSNTTSDGLGALCREGTASFLNSLVNNKFPYTTPQVRDTFVGSLVSDIAAAAQANLFKMANEGRINP